MPLPVFRLMYDLLCAPAGALEDPPVWHRFLDPIEKLRGRIDLVVVLAFWEDDHLMEVLGEPRRVFGNTDEAVLDHRGLRMHAHDLVGGRLVPRHTIAAILDQLLYQLCAGSLVLDQHDIRSKQALLLAHGAFECGIFEPPAQYIEEEEVLAFVSSYRAHREIAELGRLVGGVPALHDTVEALRQFALAVALEPFRLDQTTAQRGGRLLILAGEIVFADRAPDAVEHRERLAI